MDRYKIGLFLLTFCMLLVACSGGASGGGGSGPGPTPQIHQGVNIGNISAIPTTGNQTSTALVVTNNNTSSVTLTSGSITQGSVVTAVNTTSSNISADFGIINVTQCNSIQANGTCSLAVTPPAKSGNYLLTLNYTDGIKTFTTSQIVVYTNTIPSANGFTFSNLNNNLYIVPGGSTTYAIPFVLDNDYTTLYTYSNNPAFATNLSCVGGTTYTKGELCTLYVRVSDLGTNPNVTAIVTVSTFPNPHPINAQTKSIGGKANIKGAVGYSFNTQVSVANSITGNVVSSAFNIVVNPADGTSPQTVTLLNNGSATVSNIVITPVGSIITITNSGAGSCAAAGNSLTSGSTCTFSVNADTLLSGSGTVNITFNNGGTGNTNGTIPFTVVYISAVPGPGMSMTAGQGSLQNAVVGFTSALNIQVTNTGNVLLTDIAFTDITSVYGSQFKYDSGGTCKTDGTESLPLNGQCTLIVDYLPTAAQATSTLTINETAKYLDQGGNLLTYSGAAFTTNYSAFVSNAFVYLTPNFVSYAIRADSTDTESQTIVVSNFGGQSTTLSTPAYTLSSGISGISGIHVADGCAGVTLLPNNGNSCNESVTYGTVSAIQATVFGYLNIAYQPIPTVSGTVTAFSGQSFQAESAALVAVTGPVQTGATGGSGTGVFGDPYKFYNSAFGSESIILTYTYTNSGTTSANNFVVSLNNLPVGWALQSATCGTGATSSILANGTPCTVSIFAISPGSFWNPYSSVAPINVVTPGFSYIDPNTGLNTGPASTTTTYVTPMLFANVAADNLTHSTATAGGSYNVTFTSTSGDATEYPITITIPSTSLPVGPGTPIYVTGPGNSCTIATVGGNCPINITNIAGAVPTTYSYQYWITPNTLTPSASNSIIQYFSFTLN